MLCNYCEEELRLLHFLMEGVMSNRFLHSAKKNKADEFYTAYDDIQKEMGYHEKSFAGKTVYCNCDNPEKSNFRKFFLNHFEQLGLKRLIS